MNAVKLVFTFESVQRVAEETAPLDSGTSKNSLDDVVWNLGVCIGRVRLKRLILFITSMGLRTEAEESNITVGCKSNWGNKLRVRPKM